MQSGYFAEQEFRSIEIDPGDRIGGPGRRRRSWLWIPVIAGLATGSWLVSSQQTEWFEWALAQLSALAPATATPSATAPAQPVPHPGQTALSERLDPLPETTREMAATGAERAAPDAAAKEEPAPWIATAAVVAPAAEAEAAPPEPLPPPTVDTADPYQKKAVGVGLHPELSRVLLERLSPADYRNAGHAIRTALAETPDDAVFVWPRQRKPELALFQIGFVPGATGDCRRYVVKITKDGWLTTALPMEKCGVKPKQRDAALVRAGEQGIRPPQKPVGK
jgi:hypothetical protein